MLYEHFFRAVKARGCTVVHAVTSTPNTASVAFHKALGFETLRAPSSGSGIEEKGAGGGHATLPTGVVDSGVGTREGEPAGGETERRGAPVDSEFVHVGYDGPDGGDRVLMEKRL